MQQKHCFVTVCVSRKIAGMEQNGLQSNREQQLGTAHPCQTQPGQAQLKKFRILQRTGDLEQYTEKKSVFV